MNQYDLVASPMRTLFIDNPPANNFLPWTHVAAGSPLNTGVTQTPTQTHPRRASDPQSRPVKAIADREPCG